MDTAVLHPVDIELQIFPVISPGKMIPDTDLGDSCRICHDLLSVGRADAKGKMVSIFAQRITRIIFLLRIAGVQFENDDLKSWRVGVWRFLNIKFNPGLDGYILRFEVGGI